MTLSDLIDPVMLRKLVTSEVNQNEEIARMKERTERLRPLMEVLFQAAFEDYEINEERVIAQTVALTTLSIIDACIEDFYSKQEGKHVN